MSEGINKTNWIKDNWSIIITAIGLIAIASVLNYRVEALENVVGTYPSQDWFELRFKMVDTAIADVKLQCESMPIYKI